MKLLLERNVAEAVRLTHDLIRESRDPRFEFEAACNLLTLLSRLTRHELRLESLDHDVLVLAQRFAVSRTTCELLIRSLQADASLATIVRGRLCGHLHRSGRCRLEHAQGFAGRGGQIATDARRRVR